MTQCRNPECNKEAPKGSAYCSRKCLEEHKQIKRERKSKKYEDSELYQFELNLLKDSVGHEVELGLSRGPTVRGKVYAFDNRYGKIAVKVKENNRTKLTVVKLSYVVSFSIYD